MFPGIAAVVHFISMHRQDKKWQKVSKYAILLIILYPILPFMAYVKMLWTRPKDPKPNSEEVKRFRKAEYNAMLAHAISGGRDA